MEYNYPLDYTWSTDDILDVVSLYNAVEQAYEKGISKEDFLTAYCCFSQDDLDSLPEKDTTGIVSLLTRRMLHEE